MYQILQWLMFRVAWQPSAFRALFEGKLNCNTPRFLWQEKVEMQSEIGDGRGRAAEKITKVLHASQLDSANEHAMCTQRTYLAMCSAPYFSPARQERNYSSGWNFGFQNTVPHKYLRCTVHLHWSRNHRAAVLYVSVTGASRFTRYIGTRERAFFQRVEGTW